MKAVSLFSGGKDSFFSALIAMEQGFDVQYAITIDPEEYSMMFHFPNTSAADLSAKLLGLNVKHVKERDFRTSLENARSEGVEAVISGAIASDYQKTRIERICTELGMVSYTPIWRKSQYLLLKEMISAGIEAIVVSVSAEGLGEEDLGRKIDKKFLEKMSDIDRRIGINVAGEGGEYETFVKGLAGAGEIDLEKVSKHWKGSGGYLLIESGLFVRHERE
ncbi:ATPase [uncultured archaeon]|nr:ATPase [uncultured archaeon]